MSDRQYVYVVKWWEFQHYTDRNPPWIKCYLELLANDAYTNLSGHRRAILHGTWMEYASSRQQLPGDTRTLTRRLSLKVSTADLNALVQAGFLGLLDSKTLAKRLQADSKALALARRARTRSQEAEGSKGKSFTPKVERPPKTAPATNNSDLHELGQALEQRIAAAPRGTDGRLFEVLTDFDEHSTKVAKPLLEKLPVSAIEYVREEVLAAEPEKRTTGYAVQILKRMVGEMTGQEVA